MVLVAAVAALLSVQSPQETKRPAAEASAPLAFESDPGHVDLLRECDAAAVRGLAWLARQQGPRGAWTGMVGHKQQDDYIELGNSLAVADQRRLQRGHMGVTALCGMAFLAGGHLPDRGLHGKAVKRTVDYVLEHVHENGLVTDAGTRMYSHAFATLFLAEVHGMSDGAGVKNALERAVNLIVDSQNADDGWRYNPFDKETDLSVTVCQVQALRAARNIGIKVPDDTMRRAMDYVLRSRVRSGYSEGLFYYKITGRGARQKPDEYAINAAALTALTSAGIYDDAISAPVLDFLDGEYERVARHMDGRHYFFWYGNYYACQAFFQTGGARFRTYYERLARDLLRLQQADGRWRNEVGPGDEFSTAVACLLLQLPRQYLPIFQR